MTQYHYLDESGDPGMAGLESSSRYFAIALVQVVDNASLTELSAVRQKFHFPNTFEFKYHGTRPAIKESFFASLRSVPFRVRAVVIDKSLIPSRYAGFTGQQFVVEFITRLALRANPLDLAKDILIIDAGTPAFCRALRIKLSAESRLIKRRTPFSKIVGGNSKKEDGLQIADMIAGAVRQYISGGEKNYYRMFADKVIDLWEVPRPEK
ncbi:MAG: DUF3800 domain-containing protein [Chloroflexota bacterium]